MEYGREDLTIEIMTLVSRNKKLELKFEFKDSKIGEGLLIKEKTEQNKRNNLCNCNSYTKGEPQNLRFKDKNNNQM